MGVVGLDIGGANLKAATAEGVAWAAPFALWKEPGRLTEELAALLQMGPGAAPGERLVVTTTAELCDCFATKRDGVAHVLAAVQEVARGRPVSVWLTSGEFAAPEEALRRWMEAAASNWHALATYVARRFADGTSLLVDTGSTTTDILLLRDGRPAARGLTDMARLASGELVYVGAERTNVAALGPAIEFRGQAHGVMAEWFASAADVFVLTGDLVEQAAREDTADGRPLTKAFAAARLARVIGADLQMVTTEEVVGLARGFAEVMKRRVMEAMVRVADAETPDQIILSGSGAFLGVRAARAVFPGVRRRSLEEELGAEVSRAACAYALTQLVG